MCSEDCQKNHEFITLRTRANDFSVSKINNYMFVSQASFEDLYVMQNTGYSNTKHNGTEFDPCAMYDGDCSKASFSHVPAGSDLEKALQTPLGDVKDLAKGRRNNYYVVYGVVDLVNLMYTKQFTQRVVCVFCVYDLQWKFSAQEIIDNIPDIDINSVKAVLTYVDQNGLCLEEDYAKGQCTKRVSYIKY